MSARALCIAANALLILGLSAPAQANHTDQQILTRLTNARDAAAKVDPRFAKAVVSHRLRPEHDAYIVDLPSSEPSFQARLDAYDGQSGTTTRWVRHADERDVVWSRAVRGDQLTIRAARGSYEPSIARTFRQALDWRSR